MIKAHFAHTIEQKLCFKCRLPPPKNGPHLCLVLSVGNRKIFKKSHQVASSSFLFLHVCTALYVPGIKDELRRIITWHSDNRSIRRWIQWVVCRAIESGIAFRVSLTGLRQIRQGNHQIFPDRMKQFVVTNRRMDTGWLSACFRKFFLQENPSPPFGRHFFTNLCIQ